MFFSQIQIKHLYYVDFNPVHMSEFNSRHLAIVLKKNNDGKTVIVAPTTSSSNGLGTNKINLGKISELPSNLNTVDTYAVYNQVRTVNCDRFYCLNDKGQQISAALDDTKFNQVVSICARELLKSVSDEDKIDFYFKQYEQSVCNAIINTAYRIKKMNANIETEKSKIREMFLLNNNFTNYLSSDDFCNGIDDIIKNCVEEHKPEHKLEE